MTILPKGAAKRLLFSLLAGVALSGCAVYGPPPGAYDPYPYGYGQPVYGGPPVSIDLGLGYYSVGRAYHHRGHGYHHRHHHAPRVHHHQRGHRGVHHGHRGFRGGGVRR